MSKKKNKPDTKKIAKLAWLYYIKTIKILNLEPFTEGGKEMSTCSRKINEIKERLDGISGYSDIKIFKHLIKISLELNKIENYVNDCEKELNEEMGGRL